MAENNKITESELLAIVEQDETLLSWLKVFRPEDAPENVRELEIVSNKKKPGRPKRYRFEVAPRLDCTPKAVQKDYMAEEEARAAEGDDYINKLFIYPYLYPKSQRILAGMSGKEGEGGEELSWVDLSGNGAVVVPGSLYVKCLVNYNKKPQSRALANPYAGRSALVGRLLLEFREWPSLKALIEAVEESGGSISAPQASKAVQALEEDLIVGKDGNLIRLYNRNRLIDELAAAYKPIDASRRVLLRLPEGVGWEESVAQLKDLNWAVTGESSVSQYTAFGQGGAVRIAVTDLSKAQEQLGGEIESVPNFASLELIETDALEFYFRNRVDEKGVRWASLIQTWLELQAGDARQQDAAAGIRKDIIQMTPRRLPQGKANDRAYEALDASIDSSKMLTGGTPEERRRLPQGKANDRAYEALDASIDSSKMLTEGTPEEQVQAQMTRMAVLVIGGMEPEAAARQVQDEARAETRPATTTPEEADGNEGEQK